MRETNGFEIPKEKIEFFCRKHHIRKLSLFGSVLREDFGPDSDVDVLVEFEPGQTVGLLRLAGMEIELSGVLKRKVDLRTPAELSRYFRQQVLDSAGSICAGMTRYVCGTCLMLLGRPFPLLAGGRHSNNTFGSLLSGLGQCATTTHPARAAPPVIVA